MQCLSHGWNASRYVVLWQQRLRVRGGCRDIHEADAAEAASLQQAEAAVNKAQQVLHLSLPIADPDAGMRALLPSCVQLRQFLLGGL